MKDVVVEKKAQFLDDLDEHAYIFAILEPFKDLDDRLGVPLSGP